MQGFDTGIAVANTEYGVTLDHVSLGGQRDIGLANDGNAVTAADLTIDASATAIANTRAGRADLADEGGAAAERRRCDGPVQHGTSWRMAWRSTGLRRRTAPAHRWRACGRANNGRRNKHGQT